MYDILAIVLGFISAFISTVSGGAGLVAVPVLLFIGIPPQIALGSFNFGDLGYKIGNLIKFSQFKNIGVTRKEITVLTLIAIPATAFGSYAVVSVNPNILSKIIGFLLIILFPLIFINKNLGIKEDKATGKRLVFSHIAFFIVRAWAGFFSPGSGILESYVRMRRNLKEKLNFQIKNLNI